VNWSDSKAFVTLRFAGDELDPREISALLPVEPTRAHKKREEFFAGEYAGTLRGRTGIWFLATATISPSICGSRGIYSIPGPVTNAGSQNFARSWSARTPALTSPAFGAAIPANPPRKSRLNSSWRHSHWPPTSKPISRFGNIRRAG
jgi:hypothetical protein